MRRKRFYGEVKGVYGGKKHKDTVIIIIQISVI